MKLVGDETRDGKVKESEKEFNERIKWITEEGENVSFSLSFLRNNLHLLFSNCCW